MMHDGENKMNSTQRKFNDLLIETVDTVLSSLGEPVKNQLYANLLNNFSMEKNSIPERIDEFSKILHLIFGSAAYLIDIRFMNELHTKCSQLGYTLEYNLEFANADFSFPSYVVKMREQYEKLR